MNTSPKISFQDNLQQVKEKLGFPRVIEKLQGKCKTLGAKDLAEGMSFSNNADQVKLWLDQTADLQGLIAEGKSLPDAYIPDLGVALGKLKLEGTYLDEEELHQVRLVLKKADQLIRFYISNVEVAPAIYRLVEESEIPQTVVKEIDQVLNEKGDIKPNASKELAKIISLIDRLTTTVSRSTREIMNRWKANGWVADTELSIREGRIVIPILAGFKRKVEGLVHDESSGGKVYYIEPLSVVELNNQLKEAHLEKRQEILRLLRKVATEIRPFVRPIGQLERLMILFDFIEAKARLAIQLEATLPAFVQDSEIDWHNARHPLLFLQYQNQKDRNVVPLSLRLNNGQRILLISGPNAGGKSVALKTVGLVQLMLQHGLLVPMESTSTVGVFDQLFVDIGDNQNIDQNLSSYSSHLQSMKYITRFAGADSLVLADEMGSGTDPRLGGPIAEALIETWVKKNKSKGVITTHFGNLKKLAEHWDALENGAMAYDPEQLVPLYSLAIGKPGSSYTLEVAEKIGMPKGIMKKARAKVDDKEEKVEELLARLEKEKRQLEKALVESQKKTTEADQLYQQYYALKSAFEKQKKEMLQTAKDKAGQLISEANREIENTIRTIKETKAAKQPTQDQRKKLKNLQEKINPKPKAKPSKKHIQKEIDNSPIAVGDKVKMQGQSVSGLVEEITKNQALVTFGALRSKIKLSLLEKVEGSKRPERKNSGVGRQILESQQQFKREIDLRGMRAEEALQSLDNALDQAVVVNAGQIRVVHGTGHGILKERIRQHLKGAPYIEKIQYEHVEMGGEGVSLIYLK